ncbi:MAG: hypothetical protein J6R89_03635 [Clostridia bacterium]|nr:hypothetical protein [Clostridia bacterium]
MGSYAFLCRGRRPVARAELHGVGTEGEAVCGTLCFYETPLGLLIFAQVMGLPPGTCGSKVYRLWEGSPFGGLKRTLPLLYEKDGRAWSAVLTKRLKLNELLNQKIFLCEANSSERGAVLGEAVWTPLAS